MVLLQVLRDYDILPYMIRHVNWSIILMSYGRKLVHEIQSRLIFFILVPKGIQKKLYYEKVHVLLGPILFVLLVHL